jgi:hypothetical protein
MPSKGCSPASYGVPVIGRRSIKVVHDHVLRLVVLVGHFVSLKVLRFIDYERDVPRSSLHKFQLDKNQLKIHNFQSCLM